MAVKAGYPTPRDDDTVLSIRPSISSQLTRDDAPLQPSSEQNLEALVKTVQTLQSKVQMFEQVMNGYGIKVSDPQSPTAHLADNFKKSDVQPNQTLRLNSNFNDAIEHPLLGDFESSHKVNRTLMKNSLSESALGKMNLTRQESKLLVKPELFVITPASNYDMNGSVATMSQNHTNYSTIITSSKATKPIVGYGWYKYGVDIRAPKSHDIAAKNVKAARELRRKRTQELIQRENDFQRLRMAHIDAAFQHSSERALSEKRVVTAGHAKRTIDQRDLHFAVPDTYAQINAYSAYKQNLHTSKGKDRTSMLQSPSDSVCQDTSLISSATEMHSEQRRSKSKTPLKRGMLRASSERMLSIHVQNSNASHTMSVADLQLALHNQHLTDHLAKSSHLLNFEN